MTDVRTRRPAGAPCWVSLMAHRADAAQRFYGALFGWRFVPGPRRLGPYLLAEAAGRRIAGIGQGPSEPPGPVSWTTMLAAEDVDRTAERVRECGGTVGVGPLDADVEGRMAICVDPSGAVFGIRQAGRMGGADVTGEPGAPEAGAPVPGTVAWSELLTRESALVDKFYQAVFGLDAEPAEGPEPDRVLLTAGGRPVAGVLGVGRDLPPERGAHWMTFFAVADADAAARRAADLGGRVLQPPHDSPHGRVATLADCDDAPFGVLAAARRPS